MTMGEVFLGMLRIWCLSLHCPSQILGSSSSGPAAADDDDEEDFHTLCECTAMKC